MRLSRRLNHWLHHHGAIVNGLRVLWILCVFWFEVGVFRWSLSDCHWPDHKWTNNYRSRDKREAEPAHLLVLGDTQVLDSAHSLPSAPPLLRPFLRSIVNYNMRKSWSAIRATRVGQQADRVLFLGDMINGGRYATDDEQYESFVKQFLEIFKMREGIPVDYVVGNHDVGLGHSASFSRRARSRFNFSFGLGNKGTNQVVKFGNHSLVLLDAPWLVEEDYRRVAESKTFPTGEDVEEYSGGQRKKGGVWTPVPGGTVDFISRLSTIERDYTLGSLPVIVFSHIPFARPDTATCGRLREGASESHTKHGTSQISKGAGSGYQNLLGKDTSNWVLERLAPIRVFSADDHDHCEYTHSFNVHSTFPLSDGTKKGDMITLTKTKETTIKSFSMDVKIRRPGFQLVSLYNPINRDSSENEDDWAMPPKKRTTVADTLCLLPDQTRIYTHGYFPLTFATILLIVWMNLWAAPSSMWSKHDSPEISFSPPMDRYSDTSSTSLVVVEREQEEGSPQTRTTGRLGGAGLTVRGTAPRPSPMQLHPTNSAGSVPMSRSASPSCSNSFPLEKEGDEEDGQYAHIRVTDEELGGFTPRTPSSAWTAASSPMTERGSSSISNGKAWEVGSWKRGSSGPRGSMFGLGVLPPASPHLRPSSPWGSTFGLPQSEREREKMIESGQRVYASFSFLGSVKQVWHTVRGLDWGNVRRMMRRWCTGERAGGGTPLWKRVLWDGSMVAVPCWLGFVFISWRWIV